MKKASKRAFPGHLALNQPLPEGTPLGIELLTQKTDAEKRFRVRTIPRALCGRMRATKRLRRGLGRFSRALRIRAVGGA